MHASPFVLVCLAFVSQGRRLQITQGRLHDEHKKSTTASHTASKHSLMLLYAPEITVGWHVSGTVYSCSCSPAHPSGMPARAHRSNVLLDGGAGPKRKFAFGDIFKEGAYQPLHSDLFHPSAVDNWNQWLAPSFQNIEQGLADGKSVQDMHHLLREEAPGVYSFEFFTPDFCDKLLAEVEHADATYRETLDRPNGMNRYGIVLNQLGLEPMITALQQKHLLKLQAGLFVDEGIDADDHHCFIVRYRAEEDVGLDMHEDDSDVTVNVCLGKEFTAATLAFCGLASDDDHRTLQHTYKHMKGRAVIHRGRHRHGADDIEAGERVNFILWSTSQRYRKSNTFLRHRMHSRSAASPDLICLSYTHDKDYTNHREAPSETEALKRGVMLDQVQLRAQKEQRPVHNLADPMEEINTIPSVCLFMEGVPPQIQHMIFHDFMNLAMEVRMNCTTQGNTPPLFFVASQVDSTPGSAVLQVRAICDLPPTSPALTILDVDKSVCYRFAGQLGATTMKEFVKDFLQGRLLGVPLVSSASNEAAESPFAQ